MTAPLNASFIDYLQCVSDMLGGDLLPLRKHEREVKKLVCDRAIDYDLMRSIIIEIQQQNSIFYKDDEIQAYPTLDALGLIRGRLLRNNGDVHQISLLDRMGELTVSYFNLQTRSIESTRNNVTASVHLLKK